MKRSALKRKRIKGVSYDLKIDLMRRADSRCEMPSCTNEAHHPHHILPKSAGGQDTLSNLMAVCFEHHSYIHNNPKLSYEKGWSKRGGGVE